MNTQKKSVHGRALSNLNLGIFVCLFAVLFARLHKQSPLVNDDCNEITDHESNPGIRLQNNRVTVAKSKSV